MGRTQRNGDNYRKTLLINHSLTIGANAVPKGAERFVQTVEAHMRSNLVLMLSELILFVAAVACMTTGFVWIAGG
jgi:hypothetical protein